APAVEPAPPARREVPDLLVEGRRALPVLEHPRLAARPGPPAPPPHTPRRGPGPAPPPHPPRPRRDERGLDELARQLVELLEEQALPGVREDAVRVPENAVDPPEVIAEPPGHGAVSW